MTRKELADIIETLKAHGLKYAILGVAKGPQWRHRSAYIRTALGIGRVVRTQKRKDGKPGTDVIVEFQVDHLERFLARWKRMVGES